MPRIPQVEPNAVPDLPRQSLDVAMDPGRAAAQFGADVAGVAIDWVRREASLKRSRETSAAVAMAAQAMDRAELAEGLNPDHSTLYERTQKALKGIADAGVKSLKDPQARVAFQQSMDDYTTQKLGAAGKEQQAREIDAGVAGLNADLASYAKQAETASGRQLEWILQQATGTLEAGKSNGLISAEVRERAEREFYDRVEYGQAVQHIRRDPEGALKSLEGGFYAGISPERRDALISRAENEATSRLTQDAAAQNRAEGTFKEYRDDIFSQLYARGPALSTAEIAGWQEKLHFTPAQQKTLADAAAGIDRAPDPTILRLAQIGVFSETEPITQDQLDAWQPYLGSQYVPLSSKLAENGRAMNAAKRQEFGDAEDVIKGRLGVSGMYANIGGEQQALIALALEELRGTPGQKYAAAAPIIADKYAPQMNQSEAQRLLLRRKVARFKSSAEATVLRGASLDMTDEEFYREAGEIVDIEKDEESLARAVGLNPAKKAVRE